MNGLPLLVFGGGTAVQMRDMGKPFFVRRKRRFGVRRAVPDREQDSVFSCKRGKQIDPGRQLGRRVDPRDSPPRKGEEPVEFTRGRRPFSRNRLRPDVRGGEPRSLEMDPEQIASVFGRSPPDRLCKPRDAAVKDRVRAGQRGREKRGRTVRGVETQDRVDRPRVAVEKVVSPAAVNVQIDETGQNVAALRVDGFGASGKAIVFVRNRDDRSLEQKRLPRKRGVRRDQHAVDDRLHFLL